MDYEIQSVLSPEQITIKDEVHEQINYTFEDGPTISSDDEVKQPSPIPVIQETYNFRHKNKKKSKSPEKFNFNCEICSEGFVTKEKYEIHESAHTNNLRCNLCTTVLKNIKNYEKHVVKCKPFVCKFCGKTVRFRPNFIKHLRIHSPKNAKLADHKKIPKSERHKYKCEICSKEFTSWEYFKVHKKIHETDVNLTCGICKKVFSALACLKGHQKVHSGERPFRCEVCGKGFGQSYNLKIHSRLHSGEKPYECQICGRKMNTTASYNAHIKTHKDFKCEICNETFNQKIKYMSHMGTHETGKVLECNICGKKFGRSSNFYNHQRIHMGIKKFKCYICGNGFVKAANLDAHLLIHCESTTTAAAATVTENVVKEVEVPDVPKVPEIETEVKTTEEFFVPTFQNQEFSQNFSYNENNDFNSFSGNSVINYDEREQCNEDNNFDK